MYHKLFHTDNIKKECNVTLSHDAVLDEMKSSLKTQKCKVDAFNWNSNVCLQ